MAKQDLLDDARRGMAQSMMPKRRGRLDGTQNVLIQKGTQRVQTSFTSGAVKCFLRFLILDGKICRVKFKEHMVISGETIYRT